MQVFGRKPHRCQCSTCTSRTASHKPIQTFWHFLEGCTTRIKPNVAPAIILTHRSSKHWGIPCWLFSISKTNSDNLPTVFSAMYQKSDPRGIYLGDYFCHSILKWYFIIHLNPSLLSYWRLVNKNKCEILDQKPSIFSFCRIILRAVLYFISHLAFLHLISLHFVYQSSPALLSQCIFKHQLFLLSQKGIKVLRK